MKGKKLTYNNVLNPESILSELLIKFANGSLLDRSENASILKRALVLAVDVYGGKLENSEGSGNFPHRVNEKNVDIDASIGPDNPKNSIRARIISEAYDQFSSDENLRVYWPLFPEHISFPIKPGEHVYVMFEDTDSQHGLWLGKVPGHENVNIFKGIDSYKGDKTLASKFGYAEEDAELEESDVTGRQVSDRLKTT